MSSKREDGSAQEARGRSAASFGLQQDTAEHPIHYPFEPVALNRNGRSA